MNTGGGGKNKTEAKDAKVQSWKDKKEVADKEEDNLRKDIENLKKWVDMMQSMNNQHMKEYLKKRPDDLKKIKTFQKRKNNKTKVRGKDYKFVGYDLFLGPFNAIYVQSDQYSGKSKSSAHSGIMASVWKFNKD